METPSISSFDDVLKQEAEQLRTRRAAILGCGEEAHADGSGLAQALRFQPFGLSFSGGGIRSATFNLGILQGLARRGILPYIDYLSTVSGGGYVGSWLHGVIRRKCGGDPRKLVPVAGDSPILKRVPGTADQDPVNYLRNYSNYLAPKRGFLGPDSWVILAIWLRNMLLNQLILVPFLAAVMTAVLLLGFYTHQTPGVIAGTIVSVLALISLFVAVAHAGQNLRAIAATQFDRGGSMARSAMDRRAWPTVASVSLAAGLIYALHWTPREDLLPGVPFVVPWALFLVSMWALHVTLQLGGGFLECYRAQHPGGRAGLLHSFWMSTLSAAVTTAMLCGATELVALASGGDQHLRSAGAAWNTVIWGPPMVLLVVIWGVSLHIGLMGVDFPDASREWLARVAAVLSILMVAWVVLTGIAIHGPYVVAWLGFNYGGTAVAALTAWMGATAFGVKAGQSPATGAECARPGLKEVLTKVAPAIFLLGFLIFIATGVHYGLSGILGVVPRIASTDHATTSLAIYLPGERPPDPYAQWFAPLGQFVNHYDEVLNDTALPEAAALILLATGTIALLLPLRVNINEFSMHHLYKNRLVRCYLGAGNPDRRPNPFTGFDPKDDIPIQEFRAGAGYHGPYPIVNTALNLSAGSELSKQERQATSFVFTPLVCGFDPPHSKHEAADRTMDANGYYRTDEYMGMGGPHIGTAVAISGAAANPNGGFHTSPGVAFLLTVFNVRLGWWVGNPRVKGGEIGSPPRRPGPLYGLMWLIWEMLGMTTGRSSYVNLSDGGHFENLGLYELVRRRCRYIIIGDGEEDPKYTFESLGGAIRKCRADFGVEIDIDVDPIHNEDPAKRTHCVVGTVTYPEDEVSGQGRATGWILYLKSSLTGDEPQDVRQYAEANPPFPQQPTSDQFFTESQFESYRRLGLHVVESAFENAPDTLRARLESGRSTTPAELGGDLDGLFRFLAALWHSPVNVPAETITRMNDAYTSLTKRLSDNPDLSFLDAEVLAATSGGGATAPTDAASLRKATFFVLDLIQLMENVWFELRLHAESSRRNPKNGGWMAVFQQWVRSPFIGGVWNQVKANYNPLFVAFMDDLARR